MLGYEGRIWAEGTGQYKINAYRIFKEGDDIGHHFKLRFFVENTLTDSFVLIFH